MLYRFLLITLPLLLFVPLVLSAPDTEDTLEQAQQRSSEMRSHTSDVFDQADAFSKSPEFLDGINREASSALDNVGSVPIPILPNFPDLTDEQLQRARTDIDRLLNQAQEQGQASQNPMDQKSGPQLYVFVSFSMPDITLKRLLTQAARIDGSLILRGLVDDNMGKTKDKIMQLMEADESGHTLINGGFAIDPTLFQRFDIGQVPSFVLTNTPAERCNNNGCPDTDFVRLSGDATVEYALETMVREAPDSMKSSARFLLDRMKGES